MFNVELIVKPRPGIRDPQGAAVEESIHSFSDHPCEVHCVGRYLNMDIEAPNASEARRIADDMCKRILVNPNLETYELTVHETP